jgi:hypothetical protein
MRRRAFDQGQELLVNRAEERRVAGDLKGGALGPIQRASAREGLR